MNVSDMMSEITDAGYGDVSSTRQVSYLNDTLWDITYREKWPFRDKNVSLNFDGVSAVPSNYPTDVSQVVTIYDTDLGDLIWPERVETIRDRYANALTSTAVNNVPFAYYFIGRTLHFFPIPPASTGRYGMDYVAQQTALTAASVEADILLPPAFHRAIVVGTLYKLAMLFDDVDIAPLYQAEYENKQMQMREELLRRQYQRPDQIFVTDESDEWDNTPFLP